MLQSRFSKTGLWLCGIYAVASVWCIVASLRGYDVKSRYVLLDLPIAVPSALLWNLGLASHLNDVGWLAAYVILGVPTLAVLYGLGWVVDAARHFRNRGRRA